MQPELFPLMARLEEEHWWWLGRRAIVRAMLARLPLPPGAQILEAGCGTGGNLELLSQFGKVCAMELDDVARNFSFQRGHAEVLPGRLPGEIPFAGRSFDLVVLTDVLEHLDEDLASLRALRARLKPGGWLLMTVPACPFLWSRHDETHHHKRRYTRNSLRAVALQAGFTIRFQSYYNTFLFPLIAGARLFKRLTGERGDDFGMPPPFVNRSLMRIFAGERHLLTRGVRFPIGVSLLMLAQNPCPDEQKV